MALNEQNLCVEKEYVEAIDKAMIATIKELHELAMKNGKENK